MLPAPAASHERRCAAWLRPRLRCDAGRLSRCITGAAHRGLRQRLRPRHGGAGGRAHAPTWRALGVAGVVDDEAGVRLHVARALQERGARVLGQAVQLGLLRVEGRHAGRPVQQRPARRACRSPAGLWRSACGAVPEPCTRACGRGLGGCSSDMAGKGQQPRAARLWRGPC